MSCHFGPHSEFLLVVVGTIIALAGVVCMALRAAATSGFLVMFGKVLFELKFSLLDSSNCFSKAVSNKTGPSFEMKQI